MAKTGHLRIFCALSALLTICGAAPALSDPPTAYQALHFPEIRDTALASPPISVILAGALPITLEHTTLNAVQRTFGGAIHRGGDAAGSVTWICYSRPSAGGGGRVYWFMSNNEMGGGTSITEIAVQQIPTAADKRCGPAPVKLRDIDFKLPSIGAPLEAVERHFGGGEPENGYLGYGNSRPAGTARDPDTTTGQDVRYHFTRGVADTISVSQVTAD